MTTGDLAEQMCTLARSLFDRGLTHGSSGNLSARLPGGGWLVTPTNASLGRLTPDRLSRLDPAGRAVSGDPPTKEWPLHAAFYATRGDRAGAVVHLHSPHAVALSCLPGLDPDDCLPAHTPYPVMRLGRVALIPYSPPGDAEIGRAVMALAGRCSAVLLANHGPVTSAVTLDAAVADSEEFEASARLAVLLRGTNAGLLSQADQAELRRRYPHP
jgi:ribulose-5-phosphate 4-epimerase/fuculose-1-phosphate aldolase